MLRYWNMMDENQISNFFYVPSIQLTDKPQEYNQSNYYTIVIIPLALSVGQFFCMILL